MRDSDIRFHLNQSVMQCHRDDPDTLVVEELSLCRGEARIDLAVVNGELNGFEIKSARDTLDRLPKQAQLYGGVFDRLTLIVTERHYRAAVQALPTWWGILLASGRDEIRFETLRIAAPNPDVQADLLVELLWREEALRILEKRSQASKLRNKPKRVLWEAVANLVLLPELKREVRETLKVRTGWRSDPTPRLYGV